jgi:hypothetical protein
MKIIAKYIHGSEDSHDIDVCYVVEEQPSFQEAKDFCDADLTENRNIITIKDGIVIDCYKGTVDEINNALLDTYRLHPQEFPLLVTHRVERNKPLKYIRAIRIMLSHLSRSQYRPEIKSALRGTWKQRLDALDNIDLSTIDFSTLNKNLKDVDILKVFAFQIGQCMLLRRDIEVYTKKSVADNLSVLQPFLYRNPIKDITVLDHALHYLIQYIREDYMTRDFMLNDNQCVWFIDEDKKFGLKTEKQIDYQFGEEEYEILKMRLDYNYQALFELVERNDVFLWVYHMEEINHNNFIPADMRFVVYVPIKLWRSELKDKYKDYSDDLYDINDQGVKELSAETKKCKEFLKYAKMIREEYVREVNDFFSKFEYVS